MYIGSMYELCRSFENALKCTFFTPLDEMLKNGFLSCLSVIKSNTFVLESFEKKIELVVM